MANGKIIHKPIDNLQQLRINFLAGKIKFKPARKERAMWCQYE